MQPGAIITPRDTWPRFDGGFTMELQVGSLCQAPLGSFWLHGPCPVLAGQVGRAWMLLWLGTGQVCGFAMELQASRM